MDADKKGKYDPQPIKLTNAQLDWLLPSLAIGYVPLIFALMFLSSSDSFSAYYVFVYSGLFLIPAIPIYTIILILNAVKRFRHGTNTVAVTLHQLFSFIILIFWLMSVMTFNGSPA